MQELLARRTVSEKHYDTGEVTPDGKKIYRAVSSPGPLHFLNDAGQYEEIIPGSNDKLAGNCEFVRGASGYRLWKPNYASPHISDPAWRDGVDGDFWLDVSDENGVATFTPFRSVITEEAQVEAPEDLESLDIPAYRWTCSSNLTARRAANLRDWEWVDTFGNVVFTKRQPKAWCKDDPDEVRFGVAELEQDGSVSIAWDLSGLSYPIVMDPTTAFNSSVGDGGCFNTIGAAYSTWTAARDAASSNTNATNNMQSGAWKNGVNFACYRGFLPFVVSLGAGAVVTAATLSLYVNYIGAAPGRSNHIVASTQASMTAIANSDFNKVAFVSGGSKTRASMTLNAYNVWTLNATGLTFINANGDTKLALIDDQDLSNTAPTTDDGEIQSQVSEDANPPILTITYNGALAPTVTEVIPASGLNTGSVSVTINGTNFLPGAGAQTAKMTRAGQSDITLTGVTYVSATQLTATAPISGKAAGVWILSVSNVNGDSLQQIEFLILQDSIRERIVKNVVSTLLGITKANGYHATMKYVDRDEETALTRNQEFPNCFLAEASEEAALRPFNYWTKNLSIQISVAVQNKGQMSTELNRTLADIEKAMMTDPARGGLAIETILKRNTQLVSAVGDPVGVSIIDMEIVYRHDFGNPNTLTGL